MPIVTIRLGQSNSKGDADNSGLDASFKQPFPSIKTWTGSAFATLDYSVNNNQYPTQNSKGASEFALLKGLQEYKGETIYDIKYAVSATTLGLDWDAVNNWNVATKASYLSFSSSTISSALGYMWNTLGLKTNYTFYIFWDQGETDARSLADGGDYEENCKNFVNQLRTNIGGTAFANSKKYWINPRINNNLDATFPGKALVRAAQLACTVDLDDCYYCDTEDFELSGDGIHYTCLGYKDKGDYVVNNIIIPNGL